jgi:hypothetical protein
MLGQEGTQNLSMNNIFVFNTFLVISAKDPSKRVLIMEMELAESTLKE